MMHLLNYKAVFDITLPNKEIVPFFPLLQKIILYQKLYIFYIK